VDSAEAAAVVSAEAERAVVGRRRRVEYADHRAERATGLQITVYLGPSGPDARLHAEEMFVAAGLHARPAVLMLVAPAQRRVEIVTAASVRERLSDQVCREVVDAMIEHFRTGAIDTGIEVGLERLTSAAGYVAGGPADELPDVLGEEGP
jgi:uncharacterized membrane protein YgcG